MILHSSTQNKGHNVIIRIGEKNDYDGCIVGFNDVLCSHQRFIDTFFERGRHKNLVNFFTCPNSFLNFDLLKSLVKDKEEKTVSR